MGKPKAKGEVREASPINETEKKSGLCEGCGGCSLTEAETPSPFKKEGVIYQHRDQVQPLSGEKTLNSCGVG